VETLSAGKGHPFVDVVWFERVGLKARKPLYLLFFGKRSRPSASCRVPGRKRAFVLAGWSKKGSNELAELWLSHGSCKKGNAPLYSNMVMVFNTQPLLAEPWQHYLRLS